MLKKIFLVAFGTALLLTAALFIHLWMVSGGPRKHLSGTQLARIDFEQPIDSLQADAVRGIVQAMPGVSHAYVNVEAGTLVYSYEKDKQTSNAVFADLSARSPVPCRAFIVDAEDLATSCPAMAETGFYHTLSAWIRDLRQ